MRTAYKCRAYPAPGQASVLNRTWPGIDPASIDPSTVTVSRDPCGRWYESLAVEVAGPGSFPPPALDGT